MPEFLENIDLLLQAFFVFATLALQRYVLQSDSLVVSPIDGSVDLPEGTLSNELLDLVFANLLPFHLYLKFIYSVMTARLVIELYEKSKSH